MQQNFAVPFTVPFQVTLPPDHEYATKACAKWAPGKHLLSVPRLHAYDHAQCYNNVRRTITEKGDGTTVLGYQFTMWPGLFIEAIHHAVWKRSDGKLFDVSPCGFPGTPGENVTFLPIEEWDIKNSNTLDNPIVSSSFIGINQWDASLRYINLTILRHDIKRRIWNSVRQGALFRADADSGLVDLNEKLEQCELEQAVKCLEMLWREPRHTAAAHEDCPCGSKLAYGDCHVLLTPTLKRAESFEKFMLETLKVKVAPGNILVTVTAENQ